MSSPSTDAVVGAEPPPVSRIAAWGSVGVLLVLSILSILDRQVIALVVDDVKADLNISDTQIGLLQGLAFAIFYALAAVPIGWAVDRFPRKLIIFGGVTFWSLSAAACGLAGNFWQLFLARMGVGIGEAALNPSAVSLIGDLFPKDRVGAPMGVNISATSLGSGIALLLSGIIVGAFAGSPSVNFPLVGEVASWQAVFLVTGLPGVALAFLALLIVDKRKLVPLPAPVPQAGGAVVKDRSRDILPFFKQNWRGVLVVCGGFVFASFAFYSIGAWTPAYFSRTFGLSPTQIGAAWGLTIAISGGLGSILGGGLIDAFYRRGLRDSCIVVPGVAALIGLPFMIAGYTIPNPTLNFFCLGVGTVMIGIISAGSLTTLQRVAPPAFRGRMSAYFGLANVGFGGILGPLAVGVATDAVFGSELLVGRSLALVVGGALLCLATILLSSRRLFKAYL